MRGILLAICGLVVAVSLGGAAPQPQRQNSSEASQAEAEPSRRPPSVLRITIESVEPKESEVLTAPCGQGEENRQSDLCAQWKAADAASDAALWAMIGTVVAFFGTIGLYWQISLTRDAVKDTGEATAEMRRSNQLHLSERRPWIDFIPVRAAIIHRRQEFDANMVLQREFPGEGTPIIDCKIAITNVGKSPARNIRYRIGTLRGEWMAAGGLDIYAPGDDRYYGRVTGDAIYIRALMPGESAHLGLGLSLSDQLMSEPLAGYRVAPRFAIFASYEGEGIEGEAQTGKVFLFSGKDGRRIDVRGENLDGVEIDWGVADSARHMT